MTKKCVHFEPLEGSEEPVGVFGDINSTAAFNTFEHIFINITT